jgi:hypothetical protein
MHSSLREKEKQITCVAESVYLILGIGLTWHFANHMTLDFILKHTSQEVIKRQ